MSNLLLAKSLAVVLFMGIVISKEVIIESIAVGSTRQEAEEYLSEIAEAAEGIHFETKETDSIIVPRFPWLDSEIGYLHARIRHVRTYWWWPSIFGELVLDVRVGISSDGLVTQVVVRGYSNI